MTYAVLFVCKGNVGRSPLAEAMARRFLAEALGMRDNELEASGIEVFSAGTNGLSLIRTSGRANTVAEEIGITMGRHQSQRLTRLMAERSDAIYCMDAKQTEYLSRWGFGEKTELLDPDGREIPDPRGRDMDFFRRVRDQISAALHRRVPQILEGAGRR